MCIYIYVHMCICIYVYIHMRVCVCVCVCVRVVSLSMCGCLGVNMRGGATSIRQAHVYTRLPIMAGTARRTHDCRVGDEARPRRGKSPCSLVAWLVALLGAMTTYCPTTLATEPHLLRVWLTDYRHYLDAMTTPAPLALTTDPNSTLIRCRARPSTLLWQVPCSAIDPIMAGAVLGHQRRGRPQAKVPGSLRHSRAPNRRAVAPGVLIYACACTHHRTYTAGPSLQVYMHVHVHPTAHVPQGRRSRCVCICICICMCTPTQGRRYRWVCICIHTPPQGHRFRWVCICMCMCTPPHMYRRAVAPGVYAYTYTAGPSLRAGAPFTCACAYPRRARRSHSRRRLWTTPHARRYWASTRARYSRSKYTHAS